MANSTPETTPTQTFEVPVVTDSSEKGAQGERRLAAFRAANLAVVALFEQGLEASSPQLIEANEHADRILGR